MLQANSNSTKVEISGAVLEFRTNASNWCQVELDLGESVLRLGAEKSDFLEPKIVHAFTSLSNSAEPEWMLSLAEEHCSLYRQNVEGKNYFFWQNARAERIWESDLVDPLDEALLQISPAPSATRRVDA